MIFSKLLHQLDCTGLSGAGAIITRSLAIAATGTVTKSDETLRLVNISHAPESSYVGDIGKVLCRVERLAHVLVWTRAVVDIDDSFIDDLLPGLFCHTSSSGFFI